MSDTRVEVVVESWWPYQQHGRKCVFYLLSWPSDQIATYTLIEFSAIGNGGRSGNSRLLQLMTSAASKVIQWHLIFLGQDRSCKVFLRPSACGFRFTWTLCGLSRSLALSCWNLGPRFWNTCGLSLSPSPWISSDVSGGWFLDSLHFDQSPLLTSCWSFHLGRFLVFFSLLWWAGSGLPDYQTWSLTNLAGWVFAMRFLPFNTS